MSSCHMEFLLEIEHCLQRFVGQRSVGKVRENGIKRRVERESGTRKQKCSPQKTWLSVLISAGSKCIVRFKMIPDC